MVPLPRRHREDIPFVVLQPIAFDDYGTFTFKREVKGGAVMSVRQSLLPSRQELSLPDDRRQSCSTINRAGQHEKNAVVGIALAGLSHGGERGFGLLPGITHRRQWKGSLVRNTPRMTEGSLPVARKFFDLFVGRVVRQSLVNIHIGVVSVVIAVDPDRRRASQIPVVMEGPGWADDDIAPLHRVGFVLAHKHSIFGCLANQPRFAPQVAVGLGALARHQDLSIHPDRKAPRFDPDDRAHPRHAVGADGDDLPGSHQTFVDSLPSPVRGDVAFTRRRATFASEPGANKMVARKKPLEIFVGLSYIAHTLSPLPLMKNLLRLERLEHFEPFEPFKKFKPLKSFKSSSEHAVLKKTSRLGENILLCYRPALRVFLFPPPQRILVP